MPGREKPVSYKYSTHPSLNLALSKPRRTRSLISPSMPHRHLHLQRITTVSQILRDEHSSLLSNKQRGAIRIATDIVWADGQIGAFETGDAVDVQAGVKDAVFHYRIAFFGCHAAGAETWFICVSGKV